MSFIQPRTLDLLPHPFFIATEGMGDARLVDELLKFKGIANCSVGCPSRDSAKGRTGKDAFEPYFASIQVARTRVKSTKLEGLLVVADVDTNWNDAFLAIQHALEKAEFPTPTIPFSIEGTTFRIAVYLMPGQGKTGTLEHVLLDAVFKDKPQLDQCLKDFATCTGALTSSQENSQAKMRMSALAAAFCEDNPWASSHTMWSDRQNPVPIDSTCFDPISLFISKFCQT